MGLGRQSITVTAGTGQGCQRSPFADCAENAMGVVKLGGSKRRSFPLGSD